MDATTIVWTVGFPLVLALVAIALGAGFAMSSSESPGFWVAKACFVAAALDAVGFAIYWVVATHQPLPWNVSIPTVMAIIAVPALVLSLQWLGNLETQLSSQLFPGNSPTPKLPDPPGGFPNEALKMVFGSNVAYATKMPYTILEMSDDKMIQIDRASDKSLVVTILKIFDDRINVIARIDKDGFWVENSTRRKRPDPSSLVVYDHTDTEVLRIVFLNPTTLSVLGIFRHAGVARPVTVTPNYLDTGTIRLSNSVIGEASKAAIKVGGTR